MGGGTTTSDWFGLFNFDILSGISWRILFKFESNISLVNKYSTAFDDGHLRERRAIRYHQTDGYIFSKSSGLRFEIATYPRHLVVSLGIKSFTLEADNYIQRSTIRASSARRRLL